MRRNLRPRERAMQCCCLTPGVGMAEALDGALKNVRSSSLAGNGTIARLGSMTLPSTMGHYKLTGKLGEGGMGAVYRATDTKLHRDVAIKVLPPAFAADPDRMARFEREAQVLASLNHPHIAAIYGIEESAIVMELVEGEDLQTPL